MVKVTTLYNHKVYLSQQILDQLSSYPQPILDKIQFWSEMVEHIGIKKARRVKAFNDRAHGGHRSGERQIRLNEKYTAIYSEKHLARLELCDIQKVETNDS